MQHEITINSLSNIIALKLLLIGIQGSGKSTQGNLLAAKLHIPYLSTGHIFREIAKEKTSFGRYIKEVLHTGLLVPDDLTIDVVMKYLGRAEYEGGYILDGFPRTLAQAESFSNGIDHAIYLKVSDKEALWRLSYRGEEGGELREDDTLRAIRKRIELFHEVTLPVLNYYQEKGILVEINGEQPIEKIHEETMNVFTKIT